MAHSLLFWKGVSTFWADAPVHVIGGRLVIPFELDVLAPYDVGHFHCVETGPFKIGYQFLQVGQFQAQRIHREEEDRV